MSEKEFPFVVKPLMGIPAKYQFFRPKWKDGFLSKVLVNSKFGEIRHVVVCDKTGKPLWDQPVHIEPVGAICIPVTKKGKIRLIKQFRPIVHPRRIHQKFPETLQESYWGRTFLGVARGFPKKNESADETAARETSEEVGSPALNVRKIGEINANSAFFHHMTPVFVVHIDEELEGESLQDVNEAILRGGDYSLEQVKVLIADNSIQDALDIAALSMYIQAFDGGWDK